MNKHAGNASALGIAAAALVLASCGNSRTPRDAAPPTPTSTQQSTSASDPSGEQSSSPTAPRSVPATPAPTEAATAEILIKGFKYQGIEAVNPGTKITVTNEDVEAHSITADVNGAFDVITQVGTTTLTAPTDPGTYPYHCIFHANMKGTLIVK